MPKLVELDVGEQTAGHCQDKRSVQQNQARLTNVGIVEKDKTSSYNASGQAVARLPHDHIGDGDCQRTEDRWEGTESHEWNFVRNVGVPNVLEVEVPIVANQPSHKCEEKLSEGWVHVEEIGSLKVIGGKLQASFRQQEHAAEVQ